MHLAYMIVVAVTVLMNVGIAIPDFLNAEFVQKTSAEVQVPPSWIAMLGATKAAGGIGLLVGSLWFPQLALMAAAGLVLFFVGALIFHIRAHVYYNIYIPGAFFAFAAASLILGLLTLPMDLGPSPLRISA